MRHQLRRVEGRVGGSVAGLARSAPDLRSRLRHESRCQRQRFRPNLKFGAVPLAGAGPIFPALSPVELPPPPDMPKCCSKPSRSPPRLLGFSGRRRADRPLRPITFALIRAARRRGLLTVVRRPASA